MKPPFQLRCLPTRAERLRSEIAQLEARYDSGAMPRSIYEILKRMRAELSSLSSCAVSMDRPAGIGATLTPQWATVPPSERTQNASRLSAINMLHVSKGVAGAYVPYGT